MDKRQRRKNAPCRVLEMGRLWVRISAQNPPTTALLAVGGVVTPIAVKIGTLGQQCGISSEKQGGKGAVSLEPYPLTPLEVKSTIYRPFEMILLQYFALLSSVFGWKYPAPLLGL